MSAGDGLEDLLDVVEGEQVLKVVDEDQHQHMFFGIFLLDRRREQIVLRIVVDHGLSQDLVLRVALGALEMLLHKCGHLVHIELDIRDLLRADIA